MIFLLAQGRPQVRKNMYVAIATYTYSHGQYIDSINRKGRCVMSLSLVKELNGDHRELLASIRLIQETGSLTSEVRAKLSVMKVLLARHLEKEETDFYPVMRKAAETDSALRKTLESMGSEMDVISKKALSFIAAYETGGNQDAFMNDFVIFRRALTERLTKEENSVRTFFKSGVLSISGLIA
jgi:hypothetical protein